MSHGHPTHNISLHGGQTNEINYENCHKVQYRNLKEVLPQMQHNQGTALLQAPQPAPPASAQSYPAWQCSYHGSSSADLIRYSQVIFIYTTQNPTFFSEDYRRQEKKNLNQHLFSNALKSCNKFNI